MTKLVILTQSERRRFDSPPIFNANERALYFSLNNTDLQTVHELRTATNKVGFVLQLGYFKSQGKFFTERGSIISWQHINMQGEYDFTKHVTNDQLFDIDRIMELGVA